MNTIPKNVCRYCDAKNVWVYYAPHKYDHNFVKVVCHDCAGRKGWLDGDGNLRSDVRL